MTQPPPDYFDAPPHSTVASDRPTAPGVGGGAHPVAPPNLGGQLVRRGDATTDPRMSRAVTRVREEQRRRLVRLAGTAVATTGQTTVLLVRPGGPRVGFKWELRRLNVGPVDYAAGGFPTGVFVVALITVQEEPGATIDDASRVISATTAYPSEGTWGRGEATLVGGDYLRVLVTGLTTGATVTIGGQAEETGTDTITDYGL